MLDARQAYYYAAYHSLHRSRGAGMNGPAPIPVSEIAAYCSLFYIAKLDERERLMRYVNSLDDAYLEYVAEKQKQPAK